MNTNDLKLISNTIKGLSIDAIQKANSGHPGLPMGCSDIAAVLWGKILNYNPKDPSWKNRDRFVLSAGHGSMLIYSILHLSGYDISIDDIKDFRQLGSKTPGHPEFGHTAGIETTTGPLGQGFANGIGMAIAADMLGQEFNVKDEIIDHFTYALVGDGDMMEGISYEAASLAGHLGLGRLIYIYDSNDISIEGDTNITFSEDVSGRFNSCNWHVQTIDGHNFDEIEKAIINAQKIKDKPSLIIAKTKIGKGSPNKEGSESTHGAPLGDDEIKLTKKNIGLDPEKSFQVPDGVYELFNKRKVDLQKIYKSWNEKFEKNIAGDLKDKWNLFFSKPDINLLRKKLPVFDKIGESMATRSSGGKIIESLFNELPNIVGGSADLGPSNKTFVKGYSETGQNSIGRNIHYGIREHAMGAIQNGIAYYGGFISFSSTFFVFIDYMRPAIRMAALAKLNTIYVFTHDSFFVGEDGPTHQPVEHLLSARIIPDVTLIRPADAEECVEAWLMAVDSSNPVILNLTRQNVPLIKKDNSAKNLSKGAYIVKEVKDPDIIILASGSEVHISIDASDRLEERGVKAQVVSFPSWELFDIQSDDYKKKIIPDNIPFAVVEAGIKTGWEKYAGKDALFITLDHFGASAPGDILAEKFGFTKENIEEQIITFLK